MVENLLLPQMLEVGLSLFQCWTKSLSMSGIKLILKCDFITAVTNIITACM